MMKKAQLCATDMNIESIGVLGAGQMGNGITQVAACAGYNVVMIDIKQEYIERGMNSIEKSLAKLVSKERMTQEVATMLDETLKPKGVAVILEAQHMCMQMRGVEKKNSYMSTSAMLGTFRDDNKTRKEFLDIIKLSKTF